MAEPAELVVPLLREMRAQIGATQERMDMRFDTVEKRLTKMDEALITFRHALSGDSLLGRILTGEIDERLEVIERRLNDLEIQ